MTKGQRDAILRRGEYVSGLPKNILSLPSKVLTPAGKMVYQLVLDLEGPGRGERITEGELVRKTGLSLRCILKARAQLADLGLLSWTTPPLPRDVKGKFAAGNGGRSAGGKRYTVYPLDKSRGAQNAPSNGAQNAPSIRPPSLDRLPQTAVGRKAASPTGSAKPKKKPPVKPAAQTIGAKPQSTKEIDLAETAGQDSKVTQKRAVVRRGRFRDAFYELHFLRTGCEYEPGPGAASDNTWLKRLIPTLEKSPDMREWLRRAALMFDHLGAEYARKADKPATAPEVVEQVVAMAGIRHLCSMWKRYSVAVIPAESWRGRWKQKGPVPDEQPIYRDTPIVEAGA